VDACPSHAIYLVPTSYAKPQQKHAEVAQSLMDLAESKVVQESIAKDLASKSTDPIFRQLCNAVAQSNRILAEDCYREAGYILPQSEEVRMLLSGLLQAHGSEPDFPSDAVKTLLEML
jgi:hypothetical protein